MSEQASTELSCGGRGSGGPWYPWRRWWWSGRPFKHDVGLPPFLEPGDPWWMSAGWLSAWPGYVPAPLFVPYVSGSMHHAGQDVNKEPCRWRVSLDVAHFSPMEISLSVQDGFLVVEGKHEEKRDEHGSIARCFTRKYRLPGEIDASKMVATLSVDGVLTAEAPLPEASVPAASIVPIKVEIEAAGERQEREETPETEADSYRAPEDPEEPESPLEVHGDEAHPDSAAAVPQQHEEEEIHEKPAEELHPSASGDDDGTENARDSSEQHEAPERQGTAAPKEAEHGEAAAREEGEVTAGPGEGPAVPDEVEPGARPLSEEQGAPGVKQEHGGE